MRLDQADRIMLGGREVSRVYLGANVAWERFFSPMGLFAQGEMGVWYDPSDFSAMLQSAVGAVPVAAAGQPVGVMLDKSKGLTLGPELVTNGTFDVDVSGWSVHPSATLTSDAGRAKIVTTGSFQAATQGLSIVAGKGYKVEFSVENIDTTHTVSLGGVIIRVSPAFGVFSFSGIILAANNSAFSFGSGNDANGGTFYIDNISVRELPGHHARQPTATARPIYRASPARIDFDAVDDALIATFPASLGSNCTIARAVPGVGAQILAGQTVGTTFSDSTDHAGLVIINRALTPSETTALTAYLTAKVAA